jgi:hypothetical protein
MNPPTLFNATLAHLKLDLARAAFPRAYEDARPRHAALLSYATPAAALSALGSSSSLSLPERDVVLSALVEERQRTARPHALWQTLLFLAFEPMLVRLRTRVGRSRSDELDQRVLVAFTGALAVVRPGPFLALAIRRATERLLFPALKVARREAQHALFEEETHPPDLYTVETTTRAAEVIRIIEATGGAELREAMLATRGTDETLRAYVARAHPSATPAERARAYERLWRARSAVEERLRESVRPARDSGAEPAAGAA